MMNLELWRRSDGSVCLVCFDNRRGKDIVIRLNTDGTAQLIDRNLSEEIDLISFLIEEALREEREAA